jgi:hypothetical protein
MIHWGGSRAAYAHTAGCDGRWEILFWCFSVAAEARQMTAQGERTEDGGHPPKACSGRSPDSAASSPMSALLGASRMPLLMRSNTCRPGPGSGLTPRTTRASQSWLRCAAASGAPVVNNPLQRSRFWRNVASAGAAPAPAVARCRDVRHAWACCRKAPIQIQCQAKACALVTPFSRSVCPGCDGETGRWRRGGRAQRPSPCAPWLR